MLTKEQAKEFFNQLAEADGAMVVTRICDKTKGAACGMQCDKGIWYITVAIDGKVVQEPFDGFADRYCC